MLSEILNHYARSTGKVNVLFDIVVRGNLAKFSQHVDMVRSDIPRYRLYHQEIARQRFTTPGDVVAWLGGLQAQDYAGVKWSIGMRLPAATDRTIEQAIAEAATRYGAFQERGVVLA